MEEQENRQEINFVAELAEEDAAEQGDMFLVLRNKTRLRIVDLLKKYGGHIWVYKIAEVLDKNPSVISSHLAMLRAAGLVECEPDGTYKYYRLNNAAFDWYKAYLNKLTSTE